MVQQKLVSSDKNNKYDGIHQEKVQFKPKLRFSEFEDTEWVELKLNDITDRITRKNKNLETKRPLTISAQYGLVDQEEYFNKTVASKNLEGYYLLNKGEFAYNKSYSNGYPYGAIKRLDNYENGAISTLYICFKPKENINSEFLKEYFETSNWYKEMYKIAVEGARNHGLLNIPVNEFFETKHKIPKSVEEQKKIGEFLKIIDKKIELLEKKLVLYREIELNMKSNIFNNYKYCSFVKLNELCAIKKGNQLNKSDMIENGEYYVLNGGKEPSGYTNSWNVKENTITISEGGNSCGFVSFNSEKFYCGGHCYYLTFKENHLDLNYLFHYLKFIEPEIMKLRVGSGLPNIQKGDIENIKILELDYEKQKEIGVFFKSMNKKILLILKEKEEWTHFKKGLLQKMFV